MAIQIGERLTKSELESFESLSVFGSYGIYVKEGTETFFIAINSSLLICGCFEFADTDDGMQLAHMYVDPKLKRQGIGKAILKQAVEFYHDFNLPSTNDDDRYYYIENGLQFIVSCFKDGTLTSPPFKNPSLNEPPDDYYDF